MEIMLISTKTANIFRFVGTGDWHVGHYTTATESIIAGLYRMFPDNEETAALDLIIIEGDVYDHDLYLYSKDEELFKGFRKYLLQLAKKYDIPIRILEGTPDHDWKQSRSFTIDNEMLEIGADVRHVETLEIEYMARYDIHILYVPDEFMPRCETTWTYVQAALARHNLTQVDLCVMHGCFPHQLPDLADKIQMHDPKLYSDITRYYIVIGHIHQPSHNGKILGPGSIERLVHGDEGEKGYVRVDIDLLNRDDTISFIPNPDTTPYLTLDMRGLSGDAVIAKIESTLDCLHHPNKHLRILAHPQDPATAMYKHITKMYGEVRWRHKSAQDKNNAGQLVTALKDNRVIINRPALTADNIIDVMTERIRKRKPELVSECTKYLKDIISGNYK